MSNCFITILIGILTVSLPSRGSSLELNANEKALLSLVENHSGQRRQAILLDPRLSQAARGHALDMVTRGYFGHTSPEGVGPNERARRAGYPLPKWYHQNLDANNIESYFYGSGNWNSPESAFNWFLNSTIHKPHILAESSFVAAQTVVGVGYAVNPRTGVGAYVFLSSHPFDFQKVTPKPAIVLVPSSTGVQASGKKLVPNELYNLQVSTDATFKWQTVDAFVADSDTSQLHYESKHQGPSLFFRLISPLR